MTAEPSTLSRRLTMLAVVGLVVATPAAVLRAACVGNSCATADERSVPIPFCSLAEDVRDDIANGYYDGRSPNVIVVTRRRVSGGTVRPSRGVLWPSIADQHETSVPIVFSGHGVRAGAPIPPGSGLEDIAPTAAEIVALDRAHPDVRSGKSITGIPSGDQPRLLVQVIWKGISSRDLEEEPNRWPTLRVLMQDGAATLQGHVGFLPADPVAGVASVGTGGFPREHGVIGPLFRNNLEYARRPGQDTSVGRLVRAWSRRSPGSVIATLADDLDESFNQEPRVGLVGTHKSDRVAIGDGWYRGSDRDRVEIVESADGAAQTAAFARILERDEFGSDRVPDLAVVVASGSIRRLDRQLRDLVAAATEASGGSLVIIVTSVGDVASGRRDASAAGDVVDAIDKAMHGVRIVAAAAPQGLFLDEKVMGARAISDDDVIRALMQMRDPSGRRVVADAFGGIAVSLGKYC